MKNQKLEWTGERYIPEDASTDTHYEHLHRYAFASGFVKGKKILDLGSGEGYGSFLFSHIAESVMGIEIDENIVKHATSKYTKNNLQFKVGDARNVPVDGEKLFDVIVCFELLEHIEEHDKLLSEVKRLLKDDGIFIVSTPNKALYSDVSNSHNPFHRKELYFADFTKLLKDYFKNVSSLGQRVFPVSNIWTLDGHYQNWEEFCIKRIKNEFRHVNSVAKEPLYFIAIASDYKIEAWINSYCVDTSFALIKEKDCQIINLQTKEGQMRLGYCRLKQKIFPLGSRRRLVYDRCLNLVKRII